MGWTVGFILNKVSENLSTVLKMKEVQNKFENCSRISIAEDLLLHDPFDILGFIPSFLISTLNSIPKNIQRPITLHGQRDEYRFPAINLTGFPVLLVTEVILYHSRHDIL